MQNLGKIFGDILADFLTTRDKLELVDYLNLGLGFSIWDFALNWKLSQKSLKCLELEASLYPVNKLNTLTVKLVNRKRSALKLFIKILFLDFANVPQIFFQVSLGKYASLLNSIQNPGNLPFLQISVF